MTALARWDAFLATIDGRHAAVRAELEASARAFIAEVAGGGDEQPLSHQLSAAGHRLSELERKIVDTFHAQVDAAFDAEGQPPSVRDAALARGQALADRLADAREELEIALTAALARSRYAAAQASAPPLACPGCGARGPAPHGFRVVEVTCGCGTVIAYEPGPLMRSAGALGAHAVSQEAATAEWRAMRAAEREARAVRPPTPLALLQAIEATQLAYWRRYVATRAWFEPELGRDLEREVRARMEPWYLHHAEHEAAWRAAGRPRRS